ncbi:hypothetical protein Tco_0521895 [Tanacetum coccineum]
MFFWVDDALVPWNFAFYTQGLLPRDERPPPGSYSMEDAELINENRPRKLPTFIGEDGGVGACPSFPSHWPRRVTEGGAPFKRWWGAAVESTPGAQWNSVFGATGKLRVLSVVSHNPPVSQCAKCNCGERLARRKQALRSQKMLMCRSWILGNLGFASPQRHAAKEVTETPPPNDSSAQVMHCASPNPRTDPKALSISIQKDEEILLLKTQLADAQAEAESARSYAHHLAEEKIALIVKNNHFAGLDDFRHKVEGLLEKQEEKLRKLSIEYDEELYPHMLSTIAERRPVYGDVVKCALAVVRRKRWRNCLERRPADGALTHRHATEGAEAQPDYFLKPDVSQLQVPIFASPRDILNPFALEKEVPLKESLEAHAIRLAKKKGVKGKAILCGVGAAHLPRSDGVPVSVATVSPKDSELLGKLVELLLGMLHTKLAGPSKVVVTASRLFFLV